MTVRRRHVVIALIVLAQAATALAQEASSGATSPVKVTDDFLSFDDFYVDEGNTTQPVQWPSQVVVQPGQRVALQVPPFADASSSAPSVLDVAPAPGKGLIHVSVVGSAQDAAASTQPVGIKVRVDDKTTRHIRVVVRGSVVADIQQLLRDLEGIQVALEAGYVVIRGVVLEKKQRAQLERVLNLYPGVIDFTTDAIDAPDKMVEIDVVIVVVSERLVRRIGFDFLQAVQLHFDIFQTYHYKPGPGNLRPAPLDPTIAAPTVLRRSQWGETLSAAVDYNVQIANAIDEGSKVIARPHLVTMNGQKAEFHAGGEVAFRLIGVQTAELEKYERGVILEVTPILIKPLKPGAKPRVLIDAEVTRISVSDLLLEGATGGDVDFDKTRVRSKTILEIDQTLTLSGIYQREFRQQMDGTPVLRDIPGLKLFFNQESTLDDVVSTIVFLTPRLPGYVDEGNQKDIEAFVERRRRYMEARESGDPEQLKQFKAEHPDWMQPQPNRYASHFFLRDHSTVYQELRGEDLREERIRSDVLNIKSATQAEQERKSR